MEGGRRRWTGRREKVRGQMRLRGERWRGERQGKGSEGQRRRTRASGVHLTARSIREVVVMSRHHAVCVRAQPCAKRHLL